MKYTLAEIEVFKLRARLKKLERILDYELVQGSLFESMSNDIKYNLRYEIQRLQNRLQKAMEHLNR